MFKKLEKVSEFDQEMAHSHITDEPKAPSGNLNLRISFTSPSSTMEFYTDHYKLISGYNCHVAVGKIVIVGKIRS